MLRPSLRLVGQNKPTSQHQVRTPNQSQRTSAKLSSQPSSRLLLSRPSHPSSQSSRLSHRASIPSLRRTQPLASSFAFKPASLSAYQRLSCKNTAEHRRFFPSPQLFSRAHHNFFSRKESNNNNNNNNSSSSSSSRNNSSEATNNSNNEYKSIFDLLASSSSSVSPASAASSQALQPRLIFLLLAFLLTTVIQAQDQDGEQDDEEDYYDDDQFFDEDSADNEAEDDDEINYVVKDIDNELKDVQKTHEDAEADEDEVDDEERKDIKETLAEQNIVNNIKRMEDNDIEYSPKTTPSRVNTTEDSYDDDEEQWDDLLIRKLIDDPNLRRQDNFIIRGFKKAFRFVRHVFRFIQLVCLFAPVVITAPLANYSPWANELWWNLLVGSIERSGAAFIKFGQWAASRPDLFSQDACRRLGTLRAKAPAHSSAVTRELIRLAFGVDQDEIFASLGEKPVASGSIAQVYQGILHDGQKVAVKVRHPWVVEQISNDMVILYWLARQISKVPAFSWMELPVNVSEFSDHLTQQVNLRHEAVHLGIFNKNFAGAQNVTFPKVIEPYSHESILLETWEEGVPIATYCNLPGPADPTRRALARMGLNLFLKMVLVDNFVHADCHSENILVRFNRNNEPELVLIDVGLVTQLSASDKHAVSGLFSSVYFRDDQHTADLMLSISDNGKTVLDQAGFRKELHALFQEDLQSDSKIMELSTIMTAIFNIMRSHHIKLECNLAMLAVSTAVLEGLAKSLDDSLHMLHLTLPFLGVQSKKSYLHNFKVRRRRGALPRVFAPPPLIDPTNSS